MLLKKIKFFKVVAYYHYFIRHSLMSSFYYYFFRNHKFKISTLNGFGDVLNAVYSYNLTNKKYFEAKIYLHEDTDGYCVNSKREKKIVNNENYIESFLDYLNIPFVYTDIRKEPLSICFFRSVLIFYFGKTYFELNKSFFQSKFSYKRILAINKKIVFISSISMYIQLYDLFNESKYIVVGNFKHSNCHSILSLSFVEKLSLIRNSEIVLGARGGFSTFSLLFNISTFNLWDMQGFDEIENFVWGNEIWSENYSKYPFKDIATLKEQLIQFLKI